MRVSEYQEVINETPWFVPVFALIEVPGWLSYNDMKAGDELYLYKERLVTQDGRGYDIGPSYLRFVGYRRVKSRGFMSETLILE
jgi:hypothetical protein